MTDLAGDAMENPSRGWDVLTLIIKVIITVLFSQWEVQRCSNDNVGLPMSCCWCVSFTLLITKPYVAFLCRKMSDVFRQHISS